MQEIGLKTATFCVLFLTLTTTSIHAQALSSGRPEARSPLSEIAHDVSTWLSRLTGTAADHHHTASPPLPRPRPIQAPASIASKTESVESAPAPVLSNKEPEAAAHGPIASKKKAAAPVLIND